MPVIDVQSDLETYTLTITAQFAATPERVWDLYADPRQLEKWFGPPTYPATFTTHSLVEGARTSYYMTSPEGERYGGWWEIEAVDAPAQFRYRDGFADPEGNPLPDMPVSTNVVRLGEHEGGTKVIMTTTYATRDDLQKVLDMGVIEGATSAINQIDDLLAA